MAAFKCPECGQGKMVPAVIPTHETRLGGVPLVVQDARVSRCTHCGEISVPGEELKRWRQIQRQQLASRSQIPRPREVKEIRQTAGLSVADFAALLGVTRQTVHAWERDDSEGVQLGPGALLLKLLAEELSGRLRGCLDGLVSAAAARGQIITLNVSRETEKRHIARTDTSMRTREAPRGAPTFTSTQVA